MSRRTFDRWLYRTAIVIIMAWSVAVVAGLAGYIYQLARG